MDESLMALYRYKSMEFGLYVEPEILKGMWQGNFCQ